MDHPTNRLEVVLMALGFSDEVDEERNPNECWFNKWFPSIEVYLTADGGFEVTGASSYIVRRGETPEELASAICAQLERLMSILADEECGIK